jgi:aminoglycoside/choline kinase family phosphotransferase
MGRGGGRAPAGATRGDVAGSPSDPLIDEAAKALLRRTLGPACRVEPIAGDASSRRFYRARSGRKTAVLAVNPEPLDPSTPLYSNHRILVTAGAPVPRLLGHDDARGLVLMEDFGDVTLQRYLTMPGGSRSGPAAAMARERRLLYREACDLIVLFKERGVGAIRPGDFAARNALDRERFRFELDHFHRHYIGGCLGRKPGPADEAALVAFYDALALECDRMPRVYCHRDFMSRNLMVLPARRGRRLGLIDYQDARMGPYTYDAASLLRDSSLELDEGLVSDLVVYLAERLGEGPEEFRRDFDAMALERNIKELGTFGYMATVRNRRDYLEYVPRAVRSIRRTMIGASRHHPIFPVLDRYLS